MFDSWSVPNLHHRLAPTPRLDGGQAREARCRMACPRQAPTPRRAGAAFARTGC